MKRIFCFIFVFVLLLNTYAFADTTMLVEETKTICENVFLRDGECTLISSHTEYTAKYPYGNNKLSFALAYDGTNNSYVKIGGMEYLLNLKIEYVDEYCANISVNDKSFTTILNEKWYQLNFEFSNGGYKISIYDGPNILAETNGSFEKFFSLSKVNFTSDKLYIDDLNFSHKRPTVGIKPVIYKVDDYIVATSDKPDTDEELSLYLAEYVEENMVKVERCNVADDGYFEAYMQADEKATTYKAFLWNESLSPISDMDYQKVSDEFKSDITINSDVTITQANNVITVKCNNFNVSDKITTIKLKLDNKIDFTQKNVAALDFAANGISLDTSELTCGEYTLSLYGLFDDSYLIPICEKIIYIANDVPDEDKVIFCIGTSTYYHNNVKESIIYDNIPTFENNDVYLTRHELADIFGMVIYDEGSNQLLKWGESSLLIDADNNKITLDSKEYSLMTKSGSFGMLYSLKDILSPFGYESMYYEDGFFVVAKGSDSVFDEKIMQESIVFAETFDDSNIDVSFQGWESCANGGAYDYGVKSGVGKNASSAYSMQAVNADYMGIKTNIRKYENYKEITFEFDAKGDGNYRGNNLKIMLVVTKEGSYSIEFYDVGAISNTDWTHISQTFDMQNYSDAVSFDFVALTAHTDGALNVDGYLLLDNLYVKVSAETNAILNEVKGMIHADSIFENGFENPKMGWQGLPNEWSFRDWGTGSIDISGKAGISTDIYSEGNKSVYINATNKSFRGVFSPRITKSQNNGYVLTTDVYFDENYNNKLLVALMLYDESTFVAKIDGYYDAVLQSGRWNEVNFYFDKYQLDKYKFDSVQILLATSAGGATATGSIRYDNVRLSESYPLSACVVSAISSNKYASWYILGEDVIYTSNSALPENVLSVEGVIYDVDDNVIYRKEISKNKFLQSGFSWTPTDCGYYEAMFYAKKVDGTKVPIVYWYNVDINGQLKDFSRERHSIAVVKSETKAPSQRENNMYFSTRGNETDSRLANLVGYSGARLHWLSWGDTANLKGANPSEGVYDWTTIDGQFDAVTDAGFENIVANIYATPAWAVESEHQNKNTLTVVGSYKYNNYAPSDMKYLYDFVTEFTNRYSDKMDMLEFWNEPMAAETAFWNGNVKSFADMLKTAYTASKNVDPDLIFSLGGVGKEGSYITFYDELLSDETIYDYYDWIAFHGTYNVETRLNNEITAKYGLEPKTWWNSEGYFNTRQPKRKLEDESIQSIYSLVSIFNNIKGGAKIITSFSMIDNVPDELRAEGRGNSFGAFRAYPYIEPKRTAISTYVLADMMKKDFTYIGEKVIGSDVKAVAFDNGGTPLIACWSANDSDFTLPAIIETAMNDDGNIIDMYGRNASSGKLSPKTVYWVYGLDKSVFDTIKWSDSGVLDSDYLAPYYNGTSKVVNYDGIITDKLSTSPVFDVNTGEKLYHFNADDYDKWNWISDGTSSQPSSFDAVGKFYLDEEYLYALIEVSDFLHYANCSDINNITSYDSVQIAILSDVYGDKTDVNEFVIAKDYTDKILYKKSAADIGADVPDGFSKAGSYLDDSLIDIESNVGKMIYKVKIPISELYPFAYPSYKDFMRVCVRVNNYESRSSHGAICFGDGVGIDNIETEEFAKIDIELNVNTQKISNELIKVIGNTYGKSGIVTVIVRGDNDIRYFNQFDISANNKFKFVFKDDGSTSYKINLQGSDYEKMFEYIK